MSNSVKRFNFLCHTYIDRYLITILLSNDVQTSKVPLKNLFPWLFMRLRFSEPFYNNINFQTLASFRFVVGVSLPTNVVKKLRRIGTHLSPIGT